MQKHLKQQSRLWDYIINKKLGKGTSGQVFQVTHKQSKQRFALKKMPISQTQDKQKIHAFKEIKCLSLLSHPSIIEYKESFLSMDHIYIVMQYAQKGDFLKIIEQRKRKQRYYTQDQLWRLFEEIVKGVKYLHEKNIIHRDIKLQNIFMTQDGKVKIGDLGMAKIMTKDGQLISTRVGTPLYFAPEMIQNQLYTFPVDVWSLGCVMYYLATLQHPFQDATIQTLGYYAIDKSPKPINSQYSVELVNFINSCLEKKIKNRPNIFQLALKVKNKNQPQTRISRISIFNIQHLNKILRASPEHQSAKKINNKTKTHNRQFSVNLNNHRKIYTSLNQRKNIQLERNLSQRKNIKSSSNSRNIEQNNYFLESPESPTSRKKSSQLIQQKNSCQIKFIGIDIVDSIPSPLIKTSGFSMQIKNFNHTQTKVDSGFIDFDAIQSHQKVPSFKKIISRRSHR